MQSSCIRLHVVKSRTCIGYTLTYVNRGLHSLAVCFMLFNTDDIDVTSRKGNTYVYTYVRYTFPLCMIRPPEDMRLRGPHLKVIRPARYTDKKDRFTMRFCRPGVAHEHVVPLSTRVITHLSKLCFVYTIRFTFLFALCKLCMNNQERYTAVWYLKTSAPRTWCNILKTAHDCSHIKYIYYTKMVTPFRGMCFLWDTTHSKKHRGYPNWNIV